jgi:hypothetical protein
MNIRKTRDKRDVRPPTMKPQNKLHMDTTHYLIGMLLKSMAYGQKYGYQKTVAEPEFTPLNLSELRSLPKQSAQAEKKDEVGRSRRHATKALPA